MHSVYDTKTICLLNGLRVKLEELTTRIIFKEETLQHLSPSLVSKMNIVYIAKYPSTEDFLWNKI
jgi:hypothetical protein